MIKTKAEIYKELEDKLKTDECLKSLMGEPFLKEACSLKLTGGAVIDILEGRKPKDYDFININKNELERFYLKVPDLKFLYSSKSANTFLYKDKYILQSLNSDIEDFPFTIEQSSFDLKKGKLERFSTMSYFSKTLIPNDGRFQGRVITDKNFKARIKKWEGKGFKMPDITKKSYMSFTKSTGVIALIKKVFSYSKKKFES